MIERDSRLWAPWTLFVGVFVGITGVAASVVLMQTFAAVLAGLGVELSVTTLLVVTLFLGQYAAFGGIALLYLRLRGLDRDYVGVRSPSLRDLAVAVGGWLGALGVVITAGTLIQATGATPANNQTAQLGANFPSLLLVLVPASFLVIGPCEELLFRGIVQRRFREAFPSAAAVVLGAALFAAIHFMALTGGAEARLTTIAILFFPSLVFGAAYEYTGNVLVPAFIHGAYNATLFALLYVAVKFAGIQPSSVVGVVV
ncbi:CPBP family intramembrane glutamic endopeptidase [Halobium salinum]|uniref:CPBP family intramembrane glutamic endopeptidase n=1 Tax=Halobium salinum TaxID=1364940 RepID=A0ABD5P9R4_9EURY|nr:CPBP family intramembrane glutamic endopeptidase [Halobium salinum]